MTFAPIETRAIGPLAVSPLRLALVQARITPVLAFERADAIERLLERLGGAWTLTDRQSNRELAVEVGPNGVRERSTPPETVWVLTTEDGGTRAAISTSSVAIESDSYDRWELFSAHIGDVSRAVETAHKPKRCVRLGVRYVNEIDVSRAERNPAHIADQINPALIAPALALDRPVLGSFAELRVGDEHDVVLALRHGVVNAGTYLLDFDMYTEVEQDFDAERISELAGRFHERIESVFAWALTEAYLNELRGETETRL